MTEFNNFGAEGEVASSDLGLEVFGLAAKVDAPPASVPLTRRELREQEKAVQERAAAPTAPVFDGGAQTSEAPSVGTDALPVELKKKAPKKPKAKKAVRMPRGMSRPPATPRTHSTPARPRAKSFKRQLLSKLMTFGAMIGAGLMMVSTSLPANAFYPVEVVTGTVAVEAPDGAAATAGAGALDPSARVQSVSVRAVEDQTFTRDNYTAVSLRERLFLKYGNRNWSYTNNPNGTIQWPFPIAVPISSGFGPRIAPCNGCSSFHEGIDFTPGGGTAIQAIADGVVVVAEDQAWGFGTHVIIEHNINGNVVQSIYGHMQRGSARVTVGQKVGVADIVGLVGSTGASTGDHLHLEIHVNGVQVNPFDWLKANAN